jgi:glycosyltransferase involved in cell wall biosynthesis
MRREREPARSLALANASRIWGGAEVVTEALLLGLAGRGYEPVLLCRPDSPFAGRLPPEIPLEEVPTGFDANPRAVARAVAVLRRRRPALLMTMTMKDPRIAGVAAGLVRVPLVVRHPMDVPLRNTLRHRVFYGRLPAHSVANSRATRDTVVGSVPWLRAEDFTVIHNGVDLARIAAARPAALGLPEGEVAIGFLGRFERRKGVMELAEAWARVAPRAPRAHLVLAGAGGDRVDALRARLASLPRVRWLGYRDDAAAVVRALDVLVLPSRHEGFGLVVAEAMAAGTPVVVSRATNLPELVEDGVEGLHADPSDPDSLAEALLRLALDAELRARMGAAAAARARRDFGVERMLDEYEALFLRFAARLAKPASP